MEDIYKFSTDKNVVFRIIHEVYNDQRHFKTKLLNSCVVVSPIQKKYDVLYTYVRPDLVNGYGDCFMFFKKD